VLVAETRGGSVSIEEDWAVPSSLSLLSEEVEREALSAADSAGGTSTEVTPASVAGTTEDILRGKVPRI
jgi:hypothetical protein